MSVPRLRFPGFGGAWEAKRLGDTLVTIDAGWSPQCLERPAVGNEWAILKTTSVMWEGYDDQQNKALPANLKPRQKLQATTGDILITRAGPISRVAVVAYVAHTRPRLMISDKLMRARVTKDNDGDFIARLLGTKHVQDYFTARKSGLAEAQANISQSILARAPINLPTLPEQKKIAAFLGVVDAKIAALRARVLGLQRYKRGLMQALFNQSLRFTRADGTAFPDWKEKQLGEVAQKTASAVTAQSLEQDSGDYPVFGASGYIKGISFFASDVPHIAIVKDGAGVGRLMFCPEKSSVLGTLDSIVGKNGVSTLFLFNLLSLVNFQPFVTGSTIPHIYFKDYSKLMFEIPHPEEQARIAAALSAMDAKIAAVQRQVGLMQNFKKGLLQQMFV